MRMIAFVCFRGKAFHLDKAIKAWVSNYNLYKTVYVITNPYTNLN